MLSILSVESQFPGSPALVYTQHGVFVGLGLLKGFDVRIHQQMYYNLPSSTIL